MSIRSQHRPGRRFSLVVPALVLLVAATAAAWTAQLLPVPWPSMEAHQFHHQAGHHESEAVPLAAAALGTVLSAIAVWGVAAVVRHWSSAGVAALVLLLGCSAFETAIHAVHHLADPESAAACPASWASQHVEGKGEDLPAIGSPATAIETPAPSRTDGLRPVSSFGIHEGRAPPRPSTT
jgi:hypothetical protein